MIDSWREWLYPLGFLSSAFFGARMLTQWIQSERQGRSVVDKRFWRLSLAGNILLMVHSFIQLQFHVCVVQAGNSIVSWRNLNLMQPQERQRRLVTVVAMITAGVIAVTTGFIAQGYLFNAGRTEWFRIPEVPALIPRFGSEPGIISPLWHLVGSLGIVLFTSRFWIQWWKAERHKRSYLGRTFWWVSLVGAALSLLYFDQIKDPVNFISPALGSLTYIRNLMIIKKSRGETA